MEIEGPVLVAADLPWDAGADEALRVGDAWARAAGVRLAVCHVPRGAEDEALRSVLLARTHALTGRDEPDVDVVFGTGPAHTGILDHALSIGAGLIVIGAQSGARRALLGGVAERVVRGAAVPVVVARPSGPGRVVGATDFSDPALPAIAAAVAEARRRGTRPAIIHCFDHAVPVVGPAPEVTEVALQALDREREAARARLDETAARAGAEAILRDGPAAAAIVDSALTLPAELVVVGTHGRTGLRRLALGSVAEAVIRRAPCSVLVVRLAG